MPASRCPNCKIVEDSNGNSVKACPRCDGIDFENSRREMGNALGLNPPK
jgi:ssDNA-binding Zn-finger/Zn-ribbon topoisomerase 1